jgi:hypothetical protein
MEWQRKLLSDLRCILYILLWRLTCKFLFCFCSYNQARKIAYIPFPFPVSRSHQDESKNYYLTSHMLFPLQHAQITTLFVLVIVGFMPVLMLTYLNNEVFGFVLNLLTVMCFAGLHEVARELESPFQNVPNDVPLNNFQAQYNEGIMVSWTSVQSIPV